MSNFRMITAALGALILAAAFAALAGCGLGMSANKPEVGPAGKPAEAKANPPFFNRFQAAPAQFYDLEATAGSTFEGINKENWEQAEAGLSQLQSTWEETKQQVGDMKGVGDGDKALAKLTEAVMAKQITVSYESLNRFMGVISDMGKNYKLSPISDIVAAGNTIRNVSFYIEDKNWLKAGAKAKEMSDSWNRSKPALEQFGILGEVTKTHSFVNQLRDAVAAENKSAADERIADLNTSMGRIREYYRGR
ncbi:MAG: hypothetical protein P4N41_25565 [Negativicutes bacterium]|nr:hypothetical protein [Negativicutes bacterium]